MNLTAVDYPDRPERFEVIYELFSTKKGQRLRLKVKAPEGDSLPTATSVWLGANWFEREVYDMFGITFDGHPNMTRILTHHQFKGHPLRKDYPADLQQHCTEARPIHFEGEDNYTPDPHKNLVPLNIGPSHPPPMELFV